MHPIPANQHKQWKYHKRTITNTTHFKHLLRHLAYRCFATSSIYNCMHIINQTNTSVNLGIVYAYIILNSKALTFKQIKTQAVAPPHIAARSTKKEKRTKTLNVCDSYPLFYAYLYFFVIRPFYRYGELYCISNAERSEALVTGLPKYFFNLKFF